MLIKPIKFDLNKYRLYEKLKAKQGDTESRFLLFQLLDGSLPFNLENRSVRAYMIKPDGKEVFNDLIVNERVKGYCTLELTNQVLAAPGIVKLELMVIEGTKKLTSSVFELEVEKSINSEKSIVSTNEFGALLKGLASLNEYDNYKNEIAEARDGEKNLLTKVKKIDEQLADIETKKLDKNGIVSMANMGQDVKEAMTGGSVAVVGKNTVLTENIVDRQVTINKTNFIEYGKNLLDKSKIIYNKQINDSTGLLFADSTSKNLSDLINVASGGTYTFSAIPLTGGVTVFELTSDKKAVKNTLIMPEQIVDNSITFSLDDNTSIIRLQIGNQLDVNTLQLEQSQNRTSYEAFCVKIENLKDKNIEKNSEDIAINSNNISNLIKDVDKLKIANGLSIDIVKNRKFDYAQFDDTLFTLSTQTDASSITNGKEYKSIIAPNGAVQPYFRYSFEVVRAGDGFPLYKAINGYNNKSITIEFMSNCTEIEIIGHANSVTYGIEVDGVQYPNKIKFTKQYQKLTFASNKMKHFKIYTSAPSRFYGVVIDTRASLVSYAKKRPLCVFDGDSIPEGTGSSFSPMWGLSERVCQLMDWDCMNLSYGGTGYVNPGSGGRVPIGDGVRTDIVKHIQPDIMVVACGVNDSVTTDRTQDKIKQAIDDYYKKLKEIIPNTDVIIISPIAPVGLEYEIDNNTFMHEQLKSSAKKYGYAYIDIVFGETYDKQGNLLISGLGDWKDGTGTSSSPQPTGNRSVYIGEDGTHPTQDGHNFLGEKIANEIYRVYQTL